MNRKTYLMLASVMAAVVVALLISARPADEIMTHKGNTTIVNTTQLGAQVRGFKGATPVLIHIEKNNIRLCDTREYAKNGTMDAEMRKLFEL